ncbi:MULTISPECIES: TetR/AcrR family transcriptional regulator [unclassified Mycobacterium]|uniref:TetR/AcrR family transcriptional regulator n=1 Tax=unclassified Mycobacterium TaxID=2642494 RepID=UPI0029C8915A|nr:MULTISPECIES: TetR/AcrR family transcriptional regulator [unclassified Mycobacterium]
MVAEEAGRPNQKSRTRKDLLQAASRLMKQGRRFTVEDVAEEALVSRATAYRYFPSVDMLLVEAPLDGATPNPEELFRDVSSDDPVERLDRVDTAMHEMTAANEPALRLMLAHSVQRSVNGDGSAEFPARQNRRTALIEAALAPARKQFTPAALDSLTKALALVVGTESMVVFKDVLQMNDDEAHEIRRWAIRALVEAARTSGR